MAHGIFHVPSLAYFLIFSNNISSWLPFPAETGQLSFGRDAASVAAAFMRVAPANAADDALYVIAELVAKPDKADDLRKLLVEFVAGARKEPGCSTIRSSNTASRPGSSL